MTAHEFDARPRGAISRHAITGALFGFCFPFFGTLIECIRLGKASVPGLIEVQATTPLLRMIDLAPLILAVMGSLIHIPERKYRLTDAQRRMPALLFGQAIFSGLLFVFALLQLSHSQRDIATVNLGGSLRYRALYVHSTSFRADNGWVEAYAEMRKIFQQLRTEFPEETRPTLEPWRIFSNSLDAHGYVDWFTANEMRKSADQLTQRLQDRLIQKTEVGKRLLTVGSLSALVSLLFGFSLTRQLRRIEDQLRENHERLRRANQTLETKVHLDALTGLNNRRAFDQRLAREFEQARASRQALSVVMLDVDEFKKFNDAFGHPAGDEVLQTVARAIHTVARDSDFPARYGGEEFVIILPRASVEGSCRAAERLRCAIETQAWTLRGITASLGVATLSDEIQTPGALIEAADSALYASKTAGRNCFRHAALPQMENSLESRPILETDAWYPRADT